LLATKLAPPPRASGFIHRPRLVARLDEDSRRRLLTLVCAPAGYGKTSLVGAWFAEARAARRMAWLSLDEHDNDPIRLWRHVVAAIRTVWPDAGRAALAMLRLPETPPLRAVAVAWLNELADLPARGGAPDGCVLVLDDYHVLADRAILESMAYFAERAGPALHFVVVARHDPALPLPRLRARDQLAEIREEHLRFTPDEAADLLARAAGPRLDGAAARDLAWRTEGWAAGLRFAALALRDATDSATLAAAFGGEHPYVLDYVAEEVLGRLPEDLAWSLLHIAVLDRFCAPLCDAVLAGASSPTRAARSALAELARRQLFLVPVEMARDEARRWYRFHHLFGAALRARLRQVQPERIPELHRRASAWHASRGRIEDAIEHALAGDDGARAADLIERADIARLVLERPAAVSRWLAALPRGLVARRPTLSLAEVWSLMLTRRLAAASARLNRLERPPPVEPLLGAGLAAARGSIARFRGELEACAAAGRRAVALLSAAREDGAPSLSRLTHAAARLNEAHGAIASGDLTPAQEQVVADTMEAVGIAPALALHATAHLARLRFAQGRARDAAETYAWCEAVDTGAAGAGASDREPLASCPYYWIGTGELRLETDDLAAAEACLARGLALIDDPSAVTVDAAWVLVAHVTASRLAWAHGRLGEAFAALDAFDAAARAERYAPAMVDRAAAARARLSLATGDLDAAARWAARCGLRIEDDAPGYGREACYLTLARVALAAARPAPSRAAERASLRLLGRLLHVADAGGRGRSVIEIEILRAIALWRLADEEAAMGALDRAVGAAAPEGLVRVFVEEGEPVRTLLEHRFGQDAHPTPVVGRFLAAFPQRAARSPALEAAHPLFEALSRREREVLSLIGAGASNHEIAQRLVISTATVKKHAGSIYAKLGVGTRTQAIVRARSLGLID